MCTKLRLDGVVATVDCLYHPVATSDSIKVVAAEPGQDVGFAIAREDVRVVVAGAVDRGSDEDEILDIRRKRQAFRREHRVGPAAGFLDDAIIRADLIRIVSRAADQRVDADAADKAVIPGLAIEKAPEIIGDQRVVVCGPEDSVDVDIVVADSIPSIVGRKLRGPTRTELVDVS